MEREMKGKGEGKGERTEKGKGNERRVPTEANGGQQPWAPVGPHL